MTNDPMDIPGVEDSTEFATNMAQVMQRSQEVWARMMEANAKDEHPLHADPMNIAPVLTELTTEMMTHPQELAEKTGIAIEDLVVAMEAGREVDSFSRPVTENDGKVLTLEEKLEDNHRFETPLLNHIALKQAIDQLPEEEAQLIKFRYMDNLSQAETAKRMGKNQVSVSRSERKILEKLRRKML